MPIVTISRGSQSGGRLLAEKLGARLGYPVISREVIVEAARKQDVSEAKLLEGMQSPPGLWDRLTRHRESYVLAVQAALADLVAEGDAIYHGLAGQLLLRDLPGVIKVRLIAPRESRIEHAVREQGLAADEAARQIDRSDAERLEWGRRVYGVELTDPALYDVVVNLGQMGLETAVDLVAGLAARAEYRDTPERHRALADFVLATRVRAALAFRSGFPEGAVTVRVAGGVVELGGGSYLERNRRAVERFVRAVPGVGEIAVEGQPAAEVAADHPPETTAGEVMVPIANYPHIHDWISIREAMAALRGSMVKLADGHFLEPRYVLVFDRAQRLVGILNRRDLLRGLTPQLRELERARALASRVVPTSEPAYPVSLRWVSLFGRGAMRNAREPVRSIMSPIRGTVTRDDDLSAVVSTMVQHGVDLVPVLDGPVTVGVVLMTDVFDTVAEYAMEHGRDVS